MVLAEVASAIYGFFWTLYQFLQISAFVGRLLFQGICWAISVVHYCTQTVSSFLAVVYEDNRYLVEDARAMFVGLPELIYENLNGAYNFYCRWAASTRRTLDIVLNLPVLVIDTAKQGAVLFGEAVWMLVTLPIQVLYAGLLQLQNNCIYCYGKLIAFLHYLVMDVPLEAAAGLALVALAYFNPKIRKGLTRPLKGLLLLTARRLKRLWNQLALMALCRTICIKCFILIVRGRTAISTAAATVYDHEIQPFIQNVARFFILQSTHQSNVVQSVSQRAPSPPASSSPSPKRLEGPMMDTCILCEENLRSVAFVPCGHLCTCLQCAINLSNYDSSCPVCRTRIEHNLSIYI